MQTSTIATAPEAEHVRDPRWALTEHLDEVKRARALVAEGEAQWRRLKDIQSHEARARGTLEALTRGDAADLAAEIENPRGLYEVSHHEDINEAERELRHWSREADAARACEAAVVARRTDAIRALQALEARTHALAVEVAAEEAEALAREAGADAARLRAKHARIWGLRTHARDRRDRGLPPVTATLPQPDHTDGINPSNPEIAAEAARWDGFLQRLAGDPAAELDETQE